MTGSPRQQRRIAVYGQKADPLRRPVRWRLGVDGRL